MQLKKNLLMLFAVVSFLLGGYQPATAAVYGDKVILTILTVNDFHGSLVEAPGKNPGAAKLAAVLISEKAKDQGGTLIVSGGDMFQGSVDSNLLYGQPVIDIMNYIGFDAMAVGNHEFDWGIDKLLVIKSAAHFSLGADNIIDNNTHSLPHFALPGKDNKFPCTMFERDGIKIGVIYLANPETAILTNPKVVGAYTFTSPVETVKALAPKLRKKGAEVIIVLSHLGSRQDAKTKAISGAAAELASQIPEGLVDAIVSAHTHLSVAGAVKGISIVQAHHNGWQVGEIQLTYSKAHRKVIGASQSAIDLKELADITPNAEVQAIIGKYQAVVSARKKTVVGVAAYPLTHQRFSDSLSVLGQWSTDVIRARTGAAFAFQNDGGLRTSLPAGIITMGHLYEVLPFDNSIVTFDLTGEQIKNTLEYGLKNKTIGMLQFSGAVVEYDPRQPEGCRVLSVILPDGQALDSAKMYKVAANDFMAAGGDGYAVFKQATHIKDTGLNWRDVLCEAIQQAETIMFSGDNRLIIK